ncbi:serine/threonine-protein kinase [Eubacterium sp.]|uniref:serine/threonine protein kinase n=1 Tax=Eubacterium sp. TaxID=142586 RepID=UPI0025EC36B0|nr:serine/threonine-protein kinase [Eubacterium sp.]MCR5628669.1 serine/threonine protein kinase [Eubacterium sp.]
MVFHNIFEKFVNKNDEFDLSDCKIIKPLNDKGTVNLISLGSKCYVERVTSEDVIEVYRQLLNTHIDNIGNVLAIIPVNQKDTEAGLSKDLQTMVEVDGADYIVIEEYIEGVSLLAYINEAGKFETEEVVDIGIKLCNILENLHSQNPPIIHRDIKPSNIIRNFDGEIFLVDFGAGRNKCADDNMKEHDTHMLGTPGYAAPEQFGFDVSDERVDIYAFGMVLNTLLLGKHSNKSIMQNALTPIISKCTFMDKDVRYTSVELLRNELKSCMKNFEDWTGEKVRKDNQNDACMKEGFEWNNEVIEGREDDGRPEHFINDKYNPNLPVIEECFCTRCGDILNKQIGFDPRNKSWVCTKCGQLLFGEEGAPNTEKFPDVSWYCDKCGDYLNLQEGFTDTLGSWKCHRCGYENMIDEEHM